VNITIDKKYILGGTGILQNPNEIGYGYAEDEAKVKRPNTDKLTWKFKAQNVHDFMWAADPDYVHTKLKLESGTVLHFLYQNDPAYAENWKTAQELIGKGFQYLSEHFGQYPYPQYSIVQGGDGGMEYPMATLVTGNRKAPSLVGVSLHEAAHSWYQGVLATNESLYAWMDEGFTSYASSDAMSFLYANRMPGDHHNAHQGYIELANSGKEEGLDIHADHFITNNAYGSAAYNKGEVYLDQLNYICGEAAVSRALLSYYDKWKFKHPTANIFLHEMELQSGMVLDWYNEYFVNTTKTIDYAINEVRGTEKNTSVVLAKKGLMPMPIEMEVEYKDGTREMFYIPLDLMRGEKQPEGYKGKWTLMADWNWVNEYYYVTISSPTSSIASITIDPSEKMADVKRENNKVFLDEGLMFLLDNK
jgi:aminopeptidase N